MIGDVMATYAPSDLYAIHRYLRTKTGLPAVSLGIVGDTKHGTTGYHVGWDRLSLGKGTNDYSYRESSRDHVKSDAASALDIGAFSVGGTSLIGLSVFIVDACKRNDPRTKDIREVIYSPDGKTVRRWDRLGIRSTGDSSHLTHTHISFFRDSEGKRDLSNSFAGLVTEYFEGKVMTLPGAWDDYLPDTVMAILDGRTPRLGYVSATGPDWDNEVVQTYNIAAVERRFTEKLNAIDAKLADTLAKLALIIEKLDGNTAVTVSADEIAKALINNLSR